MKSSIWTLMFFCLGVAISVPASARSTELVYLDSDHWTFNQDMLAHGDTLFTTLEYGVQIWDIADPGTPVMIGDYYTEANEALSVDRDGDLLVVSTTGGLLYLLDISDPTTPVSINTISGLGLNPEPTLIRDGATLWLYIAASAGLHIKDVTDPAVIINHATLPLTGYPRSLAVVGSTVFVSAQNHGLYSIDISDPDDPQVLADIPLDGDLLNVTAVGNRAAVATNSTTYGFYVFDITDPAAPVMETQVIPNMGDGNGDLKVIDLHLDGTTLYLSTFLTGVVIYDVSDATAPLLLGADTQPNRYSSLDMDYDNGRIYIAHWGVPSGGLILDVTDPTNVVELGATKGHDYCRFVSGDEDGWLYTATGGDGCNAFRHVSENVLVHVGTLWEENTWGVFSKDDLVYIASVEEGLVIADFKTDPANPIEISKLSVGWARGVEVHDSIAYVSSYNNGLYTVNVANPAAPVILDNEIVPDMNSLNVSVRDTLAVTSDRNGGMNLWSVSDPGNIVHLGQYNPGGRSNAVLVHGNLAYLAVSSQGMHIVDISDPSSPTQIGSTIEPLATGMSIHNHYLHISVSSQGVVSYDISDPEAPVFLTSYNTTADGKGVAAIGPYVYVADQAGFVALRFNDDTAVMIAFFDLLWDGYTVQCNWALDPNSQALDYRMSSRQIYPEISAETDIPIDDLGNNNFQVIDTREELTAGDIWQYSLYAELEGEGEILILSDQITLGDDIAPTIRTLTLGNFPNPFNPTTDLRFELQTASHVKLEIFDITGALVIQLYNGWHVANPAVSIPWDGRDRRGNDISSGVYFGRISTDSANAGCKMILLR